jgi:hypothetical protein
MPKYREEYSVNYLTGGGIFYLKVALTPLCIFGAENQKEECEKEQLDSFAVFNPFLLATRNHDKGFIL